jgi:hypothetical protein
MSCLPGFRRDHSLTDVKSRPVQKGSGHRKPMPPIERFSSRRTMPLGVGACVRGNFATWIGSPGEATERLLIACNSTRRIVGRGVVERGTVRARHLTRRANHLHTDIIAKIMKPAPDVRQRAFSFVGRATYGIVFKLANRICGIFDKV